jgi:transcriptional regulator with XRE-family HTH domain
MVPKDIFMASKNSTLGSLIRLVRKKNSWTLRQLSERVGIPLSTLAKVETDKLSPKFLQSGQLSRRANAK